MAVQPGHHHLALSRAQRGPAGSLARPGHVIRGAGGALRPQGLGQRGVVQHFAHVFNEHQFLSTTERGKTFLRGIGRSDARSLPVHGRGGQSRPLALEGRACADKFDVVNEARDDGALSLSEVRPAGVHIRAGHVVGQGFGALVPQVARHGVVVKHIAQVLGHDQLLSGRQLSKSGVGCWRRDACACPIDACVAVVGRGAFKQALANIERAVGEFAHKHVVIARVTHIAGHGVALAQRGGEHTRGSVVEGSAAPAHRCLVHGIAELGGHLGFLRVCQLAKGFVIGQRLHDQVVHVGQGQGGALNQ